MIHQVEYYTNNPRSESLVMPYNPLLSKVRLVDKELKKEANKLVSHLLKHIVGLSPSINYVAIKIDDKDIYCFRSNEPVKQSFNPVNIDKLSTAFSVPEQLTGSVEISVGSGTVFHVQDGQLLTNHICLSMIPVQERTNFEEKALAANAESIVCIWADRMPTPPISGYTSIPFSKDLVMKIDTEKVKDKFLCICSDDGRVVFDENGFRKKASESEIETVKERLCQLKSWVLAKPEIHTLVSSIKNMMSKLATVEDNRLVYKSLFTYIFEQDFRGWLSVSEVWEGKEVFNNFGFTSNASQAHKNELQRMQLFLDELQVKSDAVEMMTNEPVTQKKVCFEDEIEEDIEL